MPGRIDERVALVTGGAGGIGAQVARHLAALGATVVVVDRDGPGAHAVATEIGGSAIETDLTVPTASGEAVAEALRRHGRLDLVHLNAGALCGEPDISRVEPERYQAVRALNLDAVWYGIHAAVPALRRRGGGAVLVTASMAGLSEFEFDPVYAMTKHAVIGLVRSLALPLATQGVRISALCPSFVDTAFLGPFRAMFAAAGYQLMDPAAVAEAAVAELINGEPGRVLVVRPGAQPVAVQFPDLVDGEGAAVVDAG